MSISLPHDNNLLNTTEHVGMSEQCSRRWPHARQCESQLQKNRPTSRILARNVPFVDERFTQFREPVKLESIVGLR